MVSVNIIDAVRRGNVSQNRKRGVHLVLRRAFVHNVPAQNDRVRLRSGDVFGASGKIGGRPGVSEMQIGEEDDRVTRRGNRRAAVNDFRARRDRMHIPKAVAEENRCA